MFATGQTFEPTTPNISFVPRSPNGVAQQCWIRLHSSSNCRGHTRALHMASKVLTGCILPTKHFRSQHRLAYEWNSIFSRARSASGRFFVFCGKSERESESRGPTTGNGSEKRKTLRKSSPNIVGSCCIRVYTTNNSQHCWPNNLTLGVVASVCT